MPLHLEMRDVAKELEGARSALVVSCPVCPQVSLAMQEGSAWIELFANGLETRALEDRIAELRSSLEERGIGVEAEAFTTRFPVPMMCLWTEGQRRRLRARAGACDAAVVLGCESAAHTARKVLEGSGCRVVQGMRTVGITNATVGYRFPATLELRESRQVPMDGDGGPAGHD